MQTLWSLTTKSGETLTMAAVEIVQALMGKVQQTEKPDIDALSQTFAEYLEANSVLSKMRLVDAIHMGFSMGYYYRVFLEKNNVTVRDSDAAIQNNDDDHHGNPASEASGN